MVSEWEILAAQLFLLMARVLLNELRDRVEHVFGLKAISLVFVFPRQCYLPLVMG